MGKIGIIRSPYTYKKGDVLIGVTLLETEVSSSRAIIWIVRCRCGGTRKASNTLLSAGGRLLMCRDCTRRKPRKSTKEVAVKSEYNNYGTTRKIEVEVFC